MSFSISFLDEPLGELNGAIAAWGQIELGDFKERFLANVSVWSVQDYEAHWHAQLKRLLTGADRVALVTLFQKPPENQHLEWWAFYREGKAVHVQNQIRVFDDHLKGTFSLEQALNSLAERETVDDDGNKISEWPVDVRDIGDFLGRQAP